MNLQTLVTSFVLSGMLGYLNVMLLQNNGIWSGSIGHDDKRMYSLMFTIFDYVLFLLIQQILVTIKFPKHWLLVTTVGVTVVIAGLLMRKPSQWFADLLFKGFNQVRSAESLASVVSKTPQEEAFDRSENISVTVFDFSHTFIVSGFLAGFSEMADLEHQLLIEPQRKLNSTDLSEDAMISEMNRQYTQPDSGVVDTKIYIDTKRQLKYYIIYFADQD